MTRLEFMQLVQKAKIAYLAKEESFRKLNEFATPYMEELRQMRKERDKNHQHLKDLFKEFGIQM